MNAGHRACLVLGVVAVLAVPVSVVADRIGVWQPLDVEKSRKSYENGGSEFPEKLLRRLDLEAKERLAELNRQLAPAKSSIDDLFGMHYFAGRILKVIPPVDPSASNASPDHFAKIVFEAYAEGGEPKSRKPVIINTKWLKRGLGFNSIDTLADYARIFSNRHEIMNVEFGSLRHLRAIFSALDPDGSMGLPGGGETEESVNGLEEGALMRFGKQGAPRGEEGTLQEMLERFQLMDRNPIDPIFLFPTNVTYLDIGIPHYRLPYLLIEEYARSMRYPGYEPGYGKTAKAALQIFYALSLAAPDMASPAYKDRAQRYHALGVATYYALSDILGYRRQEYWKDKDRFMPLNAQDVRRAALDVLAEGPVVPSPVISDKAVSMLLRRLLEVIEKDESLAPAVWKVLERLIVPEPGESSDVTSVYELDREQNRKSLQSIFLSEIYDGLDKPVSAATQALVLIGWGEKKEVVKIVDSLVYATEKTGVKDDGRAHQVHRNAIDALRLVAHPEKYARKDRLKFSVEAANVLEKRIALERKRKKSGVSGFHFIEMWDAVNK